MTGFLGRQARLAGSGAAGTGEALVRALFDEHGRAMLAYATRLTPDRPAAEAVVQGALLRALRTPGGLVDDMGSVRGWLLAVVRNLAVDRHGEVRDDRCHSQVRADVVAVSQALGRLSRDQRAVLVELYCRSRTVREAARELGVSPSVVKSRLYHALRALQPLLSGPGPNTAG